jgi:hypothetical protein
VTAEYENCGQCGRLVVGEKITVDAAEFSRLKQLAEAFEKANERLLDFRCQSRSPIARSAELSSFILGCRDTMTLFEIVAACRTKFAGRAPSKSAIDRFLKAVQ